MTKKQAERKADLEKRRNRLIAKCFHAKESEVKSVIKSEVSNSITLEHALKYVDRQKALAQLVVDSGVTTRADKMRYAAKIEAYRSIRMFLLYGTPELA